MSLIRRDRIIVPLAGPDLILYDGTLKPLIDINGVPLLYHVLSRRPWFEKTPSKNYTFILIDNEYSRVIYEKHISKWFPESKYVYLSSLTKGAAISAAIGVLSGFQDNNASLVIDLADIDYQFLKDPFEIINNNPDISGLVLTFESDSAQYSYVDIDNNSFVKNAKEKVVISKNATAGTYFFKNTSVFFESILGAVANEDDYLHNDLYYICPLINALVKMDKKIKTYSVSNVFDYKGILY